jgi:non-ribosomal peptide synthetase component E (peptide arylation enzyme)
MSSSRVRFPIDGVSYVNAADAARYLEAGAWLPMTGGEALRRTARELPDKPALVAPDRRLTFGEWDEMSERLGAALRALGLCPGDRALFQMGTVVETALALFGCFKAGVVPVCTLPQHREIEIGDLSARTGARAHFVQADVSRFDLVGFARTMAADQTAMRHIITARGPRSDGVTTLEDLIESVSLAEARHSLASIQIGIQDVLTFQLSGGSTGFPKIVPRFHGEYLGSSQSWGRLIHLSKTDIALWALPLIHNAGQILMLVPTVLFGSTLVLMPRMESTPFFDLIEQERVTIVTSIGPIASYVLDDESAARRELASLRLFMTLNRADAIEAHLGVTSMNMFGMTEGVLTGSPPDAPADARHTTVGEPSSPLDEVRLLEPGGERDVGEGDAGEMVFRGPSMTRGYYRMPEENVSAFTSDGFFRSGDLMKAHRIGGRLYYSFEGRLKDNIDRGGEKFGTEEIEQLIARYPGVADARVVAMPDRIYGEKACAFVIMRAGQHLPSVPELGQFLREQGLAAFKIPERIEASDAFPVTRAGKVDKAGLRAIIAEKLRSEIV